MNLVPIDSFCSGFFELRMEMTDITANDLQRIALRQVTTDSANMILPSLRRICC